MAKPKLTAQQKLDEWQSIIKSSVWNEFIQRLNKDYFNIVNIMNTTELDTTSVGMDGKSKKTVKFSERIARLQGKQAGIKQAANTPDKIIDELKKERDDSG